jgi:hypothetical protein
MKQIKFFTLAFASMAFMASCGDEFTNMEVSGYEGTPVTISSSAVTSDSLPGSIKLKWSKPADSNFEYMKIWYTNPADGKRVTTLVSRYTDSLIVSGTLRKYGPYTFSFQAFNAHHQGGSVAEVQAVSGRAIATRTVRKNKVTLTASQLSTDDQEPSEGPIKNLIDGDAGSFFHTRWSSPQKPLPQYIQIDFNEDHRDFAFWYKNRAWSQVGPQELELQISTDGINWEKVATIDAGLPSGGGAEYTSEAFTPGKSFKHLRFVVTKTYGNKKYFNMAELQFFDAEIIIDDPET